jgi:Glycosyltransferase 61
MKQLLKKIFPILWLKKLFLIVNKVKAKTWDRLFFSSYDPAPHEVILYEQKNPFLELAIDLSPFPEPIRKGFSRWSNPEWTQNQYIIDIQSDQLFIEGKTGWGIIGKRQLIYLSLGFGYAPYVHKPSVAESIFSNRKVVRLDHVVSLRDTGEENYFHFYNDILPKIYLLQDHGRFEEETTLVVSDRLWTKKYFQQFLSLAGLTHLRWHVQGSEWIKANRATFCKPYTHTYTYFVRSAHVLLGTSIPQPPVRIFLIRTSGSHRFLENEDEVFNTLSPYKFIKVDAASLTLDQQVKLFQSATDVVAVHGAGITNVIFRKDQPLRILELFHAHEYLPFHYIMLAHLFGFHYQALQGRPGKKSGNGGFYLEPHLVKQYCESIFAS